MPLYAIHASNESLCTKTTELRVWGFNQTLGSFVTPYFVPYPELSVCKYHHHHHHHFICKINKLHKEYTRYYVK